MHAGLVAHLATHHGLVTTAEALGLGLTKDHLAGLVRRQELERVHQGVYRLAAMPIDEEQRVHAALLAVGPGGVVSHRAALARHGTDGFRCSLIELTHRSTSLPVRDGMTVHRSRTLRDADVVRVGGLPTTSRARTLIDSAGVMSADLVARYAQRWLAEKRLTAAALDEALATPKHRGARLLAARLADVIADADSVDEAKLGTVLRRAGLGPELHLLVTTVNGHTFELDWAYPDVMLGLEVDGYGVHLRSVAAFEDDRWRRNELEIDGWRILNFTSRQIRHAARVVDQVRRAIASRNSAA